MIIASLQMEAGVAKNSRLAAYSDKKQVLTSWATLLANLMILGIQCLLGSNSQPPRQLRTRLQLKHQRNVILDVLKSFPPKKL